MKKNLHVWFVVVVVVFKYKQTCIIVMAPQTIHYAFSKQSPIIEQILRKIMPLRKTTHIFYLTWGTRKGSNLEGGPPLLVWHLQPFCYWWFEWTHLFTRFVSYCVPFGIYVLCVRVFCFLSFLSFFLGGSL